jgi:LmbE family N-acetylglucosaminyl deacetylase
VSQSQDKEVILAIGAHPDDLECTCAGTLAALVRRGYEVHMAVVTNGSCGSYTQDGPTIAGIRLAEAQRAAEICGARSFHHLGMPDQGAEDTIERRRELVDLMRRLKVTILLGHAPGDYHVDHRLAHALTFAARCAGAAPNFGTEPPLPRMPHLAYFDNEQGLDFEPHIWIDISETMEIKRQMLAAHASQTTLMHDMYGEDLLEMIDRLAHFRGGQRGCRYAEVFRGCGTYPEPDGAIRFLVRALEG